LPVNRQQPVCTARRAFSQVVIKDQIARMAQRFFGYAYQKRSGSDSSEKVRAGTVMGRDPN